MEILLNATWRGLALCIFKTKPTYIHIEQRDHFH